jgi:hypothetical protein
MNDAVALLAISQLVCLTAVAYLYIQVHLLRRTGAGRRAAPRPAAGRPAPEQDNAMVAPMDATTGRLAQQAYAPAQTQRRLEPTRLVPSPVATGQVTFDSAAISARMAELGVDVPMLARRMRKSEAEVRALLGRQAAGR